MCVYSATMDFYRPRIPDISPWTPDGYNPFETKTLGPQPVDKVDSEIRIKEILEKFKRAVEASKVVDKLTDQPDCADPEKAKLEDKVRELEKLLATQPEFVLVKRQNMQPGKYRVVAGKLHKVIE